MRSKNEVQINRNIENIAKSPININVLKGELSYNKHPDKQILFKRFTEGFSLNYSDPLIFFGIKKKIKSSRQHPLIGKK